MFSALGPDIVQFNMTKVEENFEEINKNCDISQYLLEMCGDLLWNKIFKSSIIKSNNIRFIETMYYAEDIFFVFHYLCFVKSKTILLDFVYLYRQRNNSAIHTRNKAKYIKQVESLKQFCSIGIEKLLPLTNDNNDAKKALQLKLSENANMLLYLSPLTNEKKKACFNFTKENKLHPHTKQIVKSCQKLKYKIKYSLIGLLKYRLIYYIYFDLVKIVLKIKKYN